MQLPCWDSWLCLINSSALAVCPDKGGNHLMLPNFDPANFFNKAMNGGYCSSKVLDFGINAS